jgi:hypothetical protein
VGCGRGCVWGAARAPKQPGAHHAHDPSARPAAQDYDRALQLSSGHLKATVRRAQLLAEMGAAQVRLQRPGRPCRARPGAPEAPGGPVTPAPCAAAGGQGGRRARAGAGGRGL